LVAPGNAQELETAVRKVLTMDDAKRGSIKQCARNRIEAANPSNAVQKLVEYYQSAIAQR
jgi:hypothetical protein